MARLLDGTRIYGTANVDTGVYIGNVVYLSTTGLLIGNSSVNTFFTVDTFKLPIGNSTNRPASSNTGNLRYNSDINDIEYATNSTNWYAVTSQVNYRASNTIFANNFYANSSILVGNTTASSNVAKITVALPGTTTYSNITNTTITATGITSIQSTSNYSPFVSNNFIMAYGPSLNTYAVTLDSAKSVNLPSISLVTGDGFCFEFFAKLPTLNTSGVTITTDGVNRLSAFVNTSIISISNYGYQNRGSASFTLVANTWYHFAYMGYGSETYFAVNGVVKGMGSIGGGSAYTPDGNWSQGWPGFTRDIVVSNLRITKNYLPYPLSGFTPPNYDLARLPHTHLLAFQTPHFVDVDGGYTITTSGAPEITRTNITSTGTRYYSRVGKINHNNITFGSDNSNVVITNTSITISSGNSSVSTSNVVFSLTDLRVPVGNTTQRSNTNSGFLRFNTDLNDLEYATNTTNWYSIGVQPNQTISNSVSIGNTLSVGNTLSIGNSTVNTFITSSQIRTGLINVSSIFAAGSYGTSGQVLASNGSTVYWTSAGGGGGGASVTVSDNAPFNPTNGNLWWNSNTGVMYIYYTSLSAPFASQWVSTAPPGPLGYTGSKGDPTGYTGSQGFQGFQGYAGSSGYAGSVGAGFVGSAGFTGSIGSGYAGSRGNTGYVGSKGDSGYAGSIGSLGYTGSVGPQGDPGGYTGSQGTAGFTGSAGGGGATVTISTTPPGGASAGNLWYNSDKGETYIYYDDGDSQQWVSVVGYMQPAQGYTGSTGAGYVGSAGLYVSDSAPSNTSVIWFDTTSNALAGYTGSAGTNGYTGSVGIGYTGSAGAGGGGGSNTAVIYTYNLIFGRG